jgi:hypothetical protein
MGLSDRLPWNLSTTKPIPHRTHLKPEDGCNMFLQNFVISLKDYMVSDPVPEFDGMIICAQVCRKLKR